MMKISHNAGIPFILLSTLINAWVPRSPSFWATSAMYSWFAIARPGRANFISRASSSAMPKSFTKCFTKKPGSQSPE